MAVWLLVVVWRRAGAGTGPGPEAKQATAQHVSRTLYGSVIIMMVSLFRTCSASWSAGSGGGPFLA